MKLPFFAMLAFGLVANAHAEWAIVYLDPGTGSDGTAVDGEVVGTYQFQANATHAASWTGSAGSLADLNPDSQYYSHALATRGNQIVGYTEFTTQVHAALWINHSWLDLNPPGGTYSKACATDGSQQGGLYTTGSQGGACLWTGTPNSILNISPAGTTSSEVMGMDPGHQVGDGFVAGNQHAFLWSGTAASAIDLHPSTASESAATGVSGSTQVGRARVNNVLHACYWNGTSESWVDINPANATSSSASAISGVAIVGSMAINHGPPHACFWKSDHSVVDLHALLPAKYVSSNAEGVKSDAAGYTVVGSAQNSETGIGEAIQWSISKDSFSFTLNKTQVAGQNSVQGTITRDFLSAVTTTFTTYDNSSLVTTPATVTVPANTYFKNFQITVTAVNSPINTTLYAKLGTVIKSQPLTLVPLIPTALAFTPNPVIGGNDVSAKIVINGVAGPGGRTISTFDNSNYATTPKTVIVPAGASSVTFPIQTTHPATGQNVTVTARVSAGEKTGTFRINP